MMSPYVFVGLVSKDNKVYNERKLMASLIALTAEVYELTKDEVMAKKRTRIFVQARTTIASILRFKYNMSLTNIGRAMDKDHTTVIHMLKNHKHDIEWDELYKKRYNQILNIHTC